MLGIGLAGLALVIVTFGPSDEAADPSRRGPVRFLRLTEAAVIDVGANARLKVVAQTNLVPGASAVICVQARGQEILRAAVESDGEELRLDTAATGGVVAGSYEVVAAFRLDEQPEAVRVAMDYQPTHLSDRRALQLPVRLVAAADARGEVQALFDDLNRAPRDPALIDSLDRRAQDLLARLWISEQKAAIHKLRLAMEEARRAEFRRRDFDRLLLEAHTLAGL